MAQDSAPNVLDVVLSPAWLTDALGPDDNSGSSSSTTMASAPHGATA